MNLTPIASMKKGVLIFGLLGMLAVALLVFELFLSASPDPALKRNSQTSSTHEVQILNGKNTATPVIEPQASPGPSLTELVERFNTLSFSQKRERAKLHYSEILERFGEDAARDVIASENSLIIRELMLIRKTQLLLKDPTAARLMVENLPRDSVYNNPGLISKVAIASHNEPKDALQWASEVSIKLDTSPALYQVALAVAARDPSVLGNWLNANSDTDSALTLMPILIAHCLKIGDNEAANAWTQRHQSLRKKKDSDEWSKLMRSEARKSPSEF